MNKAIFLDRDGTINVDKGYVHRIEDLQFIENVPEAIGMMKQLGYLVIVLSNQSGVARGYFGEQEVEQLHQFMNEQLAQYGTGIDKFYYCPHHPDGIVDVYRKKCACRKPANGMLLQALKEYRIDPKESWVVGDRERDLFMQCDLPIKRVLLGNNNVQSLSYLTRKSLWQFALSELIRG